MLLVNILIIVAGPFLILGCLIRFFKYFNIKNFYDKYIKNNFWYDKFFSLIKRTFLFTPTCCFFISTYFLITVNFEFTHYFIEDIQVFFPSWELDDYTAQINCFIKLYTFMLMILTISLFGLYTIYISNWTTDRNHRYSKLIFEYLPFEMVYFHSQLVVLVILTYGVAFRFEILDFDYVINFLIIWYNFITTPRIFNVLVQLLFWFLVAASQNQPRYLRKEDSNGNLITPSGDHGKWYGYRLFKGFLIFVDYDEFRIYSYPSQLDFFFSFFLINIYIFLLFILFFNYYSANFCPIIFEIRLNEFYLVLEKVPNILLICLFWFTMIYGFFKDDFFFQDSKKD